MNFFRILTWKNQKKWQINKTDIFFVVLCGRMVEWFKAAVLKTAEGQLSVGSNPTPSAIFFAKKNGERRRKSSLHCAKHNFTQKVQPFLHIFTKNEKPCLWRRSISFRLWRGQLALPVKLPPVGGWMCFFYTALRLNGGKPPWILLLPCYINFRKEIILWLKANCVHFPLTLRCRYSIQIFCCYTQRGIPLSSAFLLDIIPGIWYSIV